MKVESYPLRSGFLCFLELKFNERQTLKFHSSLFTNKEIEVQDTFGTPNMFIVCSINHLVLKYKKAFQRYPTIHNSFKTWNGWSSYHYVRTDPHSIVQYVFINKAEPHKDKCYKYIFNLITYSFQKEEYTCSTNY